MDFQNFRAEENFEKIRDNLKRLATERARLQVQSRKREVHLALESKLQARGKEIERDVQDKLEAEHLEIESEYACLIKHDRPIDGVQLIAGRGRDTDHSEPGLEGFHSPPTLGRGSSIPTFERNGKRNNTRSQSPRQLEGETRHPRSPEKPNKRTKISPASRRRSGSYQTDSTGDFDEEIPHRVPNPKAREVMMTPEPGAHSYGDGDGDGNDTELPPSSTKSVLGSYLSRSLPRPRRGAADGVNYNEKKYFKDLLGPQHKRKCSSRDD
ncbi:uncharacterized protein PG998_010878 [Apiospora kogelbergensis]|uniref:uncharacterized protein n=1 Tax=Apiospora kogelbergensis TaxID=1337665 RepID=UPI00313073D5